ncbi:pentapeptide repeat-containing protein [Prochlorococcus sp. MIT 1341]|uniref:pentapeptide repeat-containing protein n=1 Tax=Prochlorococcus sp. MIT 1341 TaxID=3096221 RepID=UPI002A75DC2E|nr:pentapeptide repeat-containing protein [Prochlorococcus sp. MIT 1341]
MWNQLIAFVGPLISLCTIGFFASIALAITPPEIRGQGDLPISPDMHGRDLNNYEFVKSDLRGFDFSDADLRGAVFNNSQLQQANLHGADLEDVVAFASIFEGANLTDANFTNCLLMESNFNDAQIAGADFTNAVIDKSQQKNLCMRAEGTNSQTGISTYESLACSG